jgi:transposase
MSDPFLLRVRHLAWIAPYSPPPHGVPRVHDRRVISGIIYMIRNGRQWKDALKCPNQGS